MQDLKDEHGFLDPEKAAVHIITVDKGFTTPEIEAVKMLNNGGIDKERAVKWLEARADRDIDTSLDWLDMLEVPG